MSRMSDAPLGILLSLLGASVRASDGANAVVGASML